MGLTALVAVIPILYFFWALAIKRMKGYIAGLTTLLIALILAVAAIRNACTVGRNVCYTWSSVWHNTDWLDYYQFSVPI